MAFDPSTTKPEIDFPGDQAPSELVIEDLKDGDGAEAGAGDTIKAHYVGVAHSTGRSSTRPGTAAPPWSSASVSASHPRLGRGHRGDEGRRPTPAHHPGPHGLRRARRRQLIKPGETLIFVVDLVGVRLSTPASPEPSRTSGAAQRVPAPAAYRPAAAAARNAAASSSSPRPMVDRRTGARRSAASRPSTAPSTSVRRPPVASARSSACCATSAPIAPSRRGNRDRGRARARPGRMPCGCGARCRGGAGAHPPPRRAARRRRATEDVGGVEGLTGGGAGEPPRCAVPTFPAPAPPRPPRHAARARPRAAGVQADSLVVPAVGLPHGDGPGNPVRGAQARHGAGERRGQGAAVRHDVGDPGPWPLRADPGHDRGECRVQVRDHHGHPAEVLRGGHHVVVGAVPARPRPGTSAAGACSGPSRCAHASAWVGRQAVGHGDDERQAPGAQAPQQRGGVEQHGVTPVCGSPTTSV